MVVIFLQNLIPTLVHRSLKTPFGRYYDAVNGDVKRLMKIGFNTNKADKALKTIRKKIIDVYGVELSVLDTMRKEMSLLIMETESIIDRKKTTAFVRASQDIEIKPIKNKTKREITAEITAYLKKPFDLEKESIESVYNLYEAMRHD